MKITHITRTEMSKIDLSDNVRYSARCDEHLLKLDYMTDGIHRRHITLDEWTTKATELFKEKIRQNENK